MYTNHAIYSPQVVFFRDAKFTLLEYPVTASVLTLPVVNMGQVVLKSEDIQEAKHVMKERMRLCLAIFAHTNIAIPFDINTYACRISCPPNGWNDSILSGNAIINI